MKTLLAVVMVLMVAESAAAVDRQQLLSTAEWVELNNRSEAQGFAYIKGLMDALGAVGNFTCAKPVDFALSTMRIRVDFKSNPEEVPTWFIFALMADLTRNYHCRFIDTDRLDYTNKKLAEWERGK